jgi:hypothetical protein
LRLVNQHLKKKGILYILASKANRRALFSWHFSFKLLYFEPEDNGGFSFLIIGMSGARTSDAKSASGRPAPAAHPVSSFLAQHLRVLLPSCLCCLVPIWSCMLVGGNHRVCCHQKQQWLATPGRALLLPTCCCWLAASSWNKERERERATEHGCSFVLHACYHAHGYSFVLRACCRTRLASRAHVGTTVPEGTTSACPP